MTTVVAILSDIHFTSGKGHPIPSRADAIAGAISTASHNIETIVLLLSGDIANSGFAEEFEVAKHFLAQLRGSLSRRMPHSTIHVLAVPGNHDCFLPTEGIEHRLARVNSSLRTIREEEPDALFLKDLISVQDEFWSFAASATDQTRISISGRLCNQVTISTPAGAILFNLLNSALLSQRHEEKSGLHLPVEFFRQNIDPPATDVLAISVLHHPSYWIEPTTFTAMRQVLNKVSDLVITGHEHFSAAYKQIQMSGEDVTFYESPALYDSKFPNSSAFRVLAFDLRTARQKDLLFRWKKDIYRLEQPDSSEWKAIARNESSRGHQFEFSIEHIRKLEDTGIAYSHPTTSNFKLSDVFVYPNLRLNKAKGTQETVRGRDVLAYISKQTSITSIQGATFAGKSALAKQLTLQLNTHLGRIPIFLSGRQLDNSSPEDLQKILIRAYKTQYADPDTDAFLQLEPERRAVVIDDWHHARLNEEQRSDMYSALGRFASCTVLLVDDIFRMKQLAAEAFTAGSSADPVRAQAEIVGLSYVSRGALIANWYRLRREAGSQPPELDNAVKEVEDRISRLLGKESLPPYAFFVLCMLQASDSKRLENTAGGSFGAYHQVLVTTALTRGNLNDSQLAGKIALCSEIAHHFWSNKVTVASEATVRDIAAVYAEKHLFSLQVDDLLRALVEARVLERSENHYRFAYSQFFYYFVAWYIRQHLDTEEAVELRKRIDEMVDAISSIENSSIVMFLIYFATDRNRIIERLLRNADAIFAGIKPATLQDDVRAFEFRDDLLPTPEISDDPDINENRQVERLSKDEYEEARKPREEDSYGAFSYDESLSEAKKIHLAEKNIEALGQVVRSFSTSLPGSVKVSVLTGTYNLGLRTMGYLLGKIAQYLTFRAGVLRGEARDWRFVSEDRSVTEMLEQLDELMLIIGKAIAIHYTRKLSDSVGVADNELAYAGALKSLPSSSAITLIDSAIQIDHSRSFPEEIIEKRIKEVKKFPFAASVLDFLIARHVLLYKLEPATRRRIALMAGWNPQRVEEFSQRTQKLL